MKIIRKTVTGGGTLLLFVAMYKCFVYGAPLQGSERTLYMMLTAIFCILHGWLLWERYGMLSGSAERIQSLRR